MLTLGKYSKLNVEQALKLAQIKFAMVAQGGDLAEEKK
ncbi:MAG: hypothetical protein AB1656_08225 [Candidatus Omnitrophota bacterium]